MYDIYVCYILNHIACGALNGSIPLLVLYGITPDISIMLLYTFYQPVFYATHDQHFPSESEERAAFWVGFGEHCGDAMTHKLLDTITQKIIYRSAVRPLTKSNPNHRLTEDGGEASTSKQPSSKIPTVLIRSRQDDADPSHIKPMPEFDPDDLIGRTFLLPPQENGERLRAKVTKKVVQDIEAEDANRIPNINFILDIGEGKVEELITYNQLLDHFEQAEEEDNFMDQELYKFRAIIGPEGPLKATDPNWKGSKWNVQIECETPAHQKQPSSKIPTVLIRSRQDDADPSHIKPMPEFDPDDLIGRTFLLPPQENGERLRAKVTKKVVQDIEAEDANRIPNINFILDIGEGKVEELITYNQLLDHFEQAEEEDNFMDQELYKFRAIIGPEGPLKATDPNWKGRRWNVQIEWETPAHQNNQVLKFQLFLLDQDRMMLIHLTLSLCLNLILMT